MCFICFVRHQRDKEISSDRDNIFASQDGQENKQRDIHVLCCIQQMKHDLGHGDIMIQPLPLVVSSKPVFCIAHNTYKPIQQIISVHKECYNEPESNTMESFAPHNVS